MAVVLLLNFLDLFEGVGAQQEVGLFKRWEGMLGRTRGQAGPGPAVREVGGAEGLAKAGGLRGVLLPKLVAPDDLD